MYRMIHSIILLLTGSCFALYTEEQVVPCDLPCSEVNDSLRYIAVLAEDCVIKPSPPFVSSIGAYNITLRWNASNISDVRYIVQHKYVSIAGEWEYTQAVADNSYTVTNLHPYTEYWFRVIWLICHLQYYSASSPAYRTLAAGVPSDAPQIESLASFSSDTVEVSWLPPQFPNGHIIGYILNLYTNGDVNRLVSVVGRQNFQFYGTKAATTYRFSITARNEYGDGPAAEANVTTPSSPDPDKAMWLFLSRNETLKKRDNLKDHTHEAECLEVQSQIKSVTVNVYTQTVYFSQGNHILVKGAANFSKSTLQTFHTGNDTITSLSIDWLYRKMFFIMKNQIYMCDVTNCTTTVTNIPMQDGVKPKKIVADPYNGYLFLLMDDGIYRMILPASPVHSNVTEQIVRSASIVDFMINVQSKRLIFAKRESLFHLVSVFLDGSDDQRLREVNDEVISFIYFNDSLMFTDGDSVLYEEFYLDQYWYNEYVVSCSITSASSTGFNNLILYGESTQPIPLPGCPEHVMVVFGMRSAAILWRPPRLTVGASAAAWQKWTYSVLLSSESHGVQQIFNNITDTGITVASLNISTKYEITVRASSHAGDSQWTDPVAGTTLDAVEEELYILAVGSNGLWRQSLDKFGPGELLSDKPQYVSDLDWYNNTLCWSNETGHICVWNMRDLTEFSPVCIPGINRAQSLSFDWIGHYIYWADMLNAKIHRTSLKAFTNEIVHVGRNLVTDLAVDSINAFLYWTTEYSLEVSRLNGQDHVIIQNLTQFSSSQVVALTLDLKDEWLYWLVKNGLLINLYRTPLQKDSYTNATITEFASWSTSEISQHSLAFYSNRLFWINGQKYLTVQEVPQNVCTPFSQPEEFTEFTLALHELKRLPGNFSHIPEVIPDPISISSFDIRGNYSHFTIVWKGPSNIEYGTLFYCVESSILQQMARRSSRFCSTSGKFTESFYDVEGLEPYTEIDFAVTPYTYWGKGQTTSVTLRSPQGVPTAPLNPRVYSTQSSRLFDEKMTDIELRWNKPNRSNGILINYAISYRLTNESQDNNIVGTWLTINTTASKETFHLYNVSTETLLQFQVQAYTYLGPGPFSEMANITISDIHPVPSLISIFLNQISFIDMDIKEALWNLTAEGNIQMASYIALDGNIYYLVEDMILWRDTHKHSTFLLLKDERLFGSQSMTADWIARRLYLAIHSKQNGTQLLYIDLEHKEKSLNPIATFHEEFVIDTLVAYPLLSRLYCIGFDQTVGAILYYDTHNNTIVNVLRQNSEKEMNMKDCDCHMENWGLIKLLALDTTNTTIALLFLSCNETSIWASDLDGCNCWKVTDLKDLAECSAITSLAADDYFIYWSVEKHGNSSIYGARKADKKIELLTTNADEHIQILSYSTSLQPFPDKRCLVPAPLALKPVLQSITNTSFTLELPPVSVDELSCLFIQSSTPTYLITYRNMSNDQHQDSSDVAADTTLEFQDQIALIPGLQPFTDYEIEVRVTNFYLFLLDEPPEVSVVTGKTHYGVPEATHITGVTVLSDSVVNISWAQPSKPNGPLNLVRYQIKSDKFALNPSVPLTKKEFPDEKLQWCFQNLKGGTGYEFKVLAFHPDENWYTESTPMHAKTFQSPAAPYNITAGNTSLVLEWIAPDEAITDFWFEEQQSKYGSWNKSGEKSCTTRSVYICTISGLVPNTIYNIRAVVLFTTGFEGISSLANFRTAAGVPSKPGVPQNVPGDKSTIQWKVPEDNGSNMIYNILEYRKVHSDGKSLELWQLAYNGSCGNICVWKSRKLDGTFQFRAAAANSIGISNYSDTSENLLLRKENESNEVAIVVGSVLGILLILILVIAFVIYKKAKKKPVDEMNITVFHEDKELAKLRGFHYAVGLGNACYAIRTVPTKIEMENLPTFPREDLTLSVFLGSGAFGEVYEGTAKDILGPDTGFHKVAVKTLKSDATDNEKIEFLKEAHLMSQFHHANILKLLGVCLFNEPQYIILELMNGGDLLTYLREARPSSQHEIPLLSPMDLLDIAVDITKGCAYLEKMHFVHRDLAARNCLVSVKEYNSPDRTVKIGDFGLARDVYKSDYYRKNGEGLLPVRWMAPESLIDGIFTTRSDVWSFGVLMWELFTLGQQPYQGFSNMEVIHYVRSGQRMDSPDNCPDKLLDLMLDCWAQDPLKRPSFAHIQGQLDELKGCSLRCTYPKKKRKDLEGINNLGFEDDNILGSASEESSSVTLTEARNADGLNYLMVAI